MNLVDQISELKNTILSLKAVAASFSHSYTEGMPDSNILSIKVDPDNYTYLFSVILGQICEAKQRVEELNAAAEEMFCNKD